MGHVVLSTPIVTMFVVYSLLMLYIGFFFYNQTETTEALFFCDWSRGPLSQGFWAGGGG
ncbi:sodium:proline symporter, partial [Helicobacter pylori]|nr:sodium:proline symporter [Helicobacter pylori]